LNQSRRNVVEVVELNALALRKSVCAGMLVAILLIGFSVSSTPSAGMLAGFWSAPVMVTEEPTFDLEVDGDTMYIVGSDNMGYTYDGGAHWSFVPIANSMISAKGLNVFRADLVVDEVYTEYGIEYVQSIWFSLSDNSGQSWSEPVKVITLDGWSDGAFNIAVLDGVVYIYTYDGQPGSDVPGASMKILWSADLGVTWSGPAIIADGIYVEDPITGNLVLVNGVLYVAYKHMVTWDPPTSKIFVASSTDGGATWTSSVAILGEYAYSPVIAADQTTSMLYLTCVDKGGIYFADSDDGTSWSMPMKIGQSTDSTDASGMHYLVADSGRVFEAYLDYTASDVQPVYELRISASTDGGSTWEDLGDVTGMTTNAMMPLLGLSPGKLHFFWSDIGTGGWWSDTMPTYYRCMTLGTVSFGEITVVRGKAGSPAADSKVMSYLPEEDGWLWVSAVSGNLPVLKVDVYDKSSGKAVVISTQYLIFGRQTTGPLESSKVKVTADHDYVVRLTPIGMRGASAEVTGLFMAN